MPLVIGVLPLVVVAFSRVLYPYDLGHYEAGTWEPARLLWTGANPYTLARTVEPPYVMAPYGPAYYALVGLGLRLFGSQLWFGRAVAVIALALAGVCVVVLARRFAGRGAGPVAALAFAAQLPVQAWMAVHRPDALALALGLGALTLATAGPPVSLPAVIAAAVAAALSLLVRQTVVVPVLAILGWLLIERRGRAAVAFVLVTGALVTLPMAVLQLTSDGGYLWQQFTLPAGVGVSGEQLRILASLFARHLGVWVLAGLVAAWPLVRTDDGDRARIEGQATGCSWSATSARFTVVLAGSIVAAVLLAVVTSARRGSNVNYWLEPAALVAVGVALVSRRIGVRWQTRAVWALALASAVGAMTFLPAELTRWRDDRPYLATLVATLHGIEPRGAPVLSVYPELAVYAGRPYVFNDGIQYDGRSEPHHAILARTLRERRLPALVLPYPEGPRGYTRVAFDVRGADRARVYLFTRDDDRAPSVP